jgi:hypothetical protein
MKVLDEHVPAEQRALLRGHLVSARQIGNGLGRPGMPDEEIIPLLQLLRRPTFFTFDMGFYERRLCSDQYCLVCIDARDHEAASFVRRLVRHPRFNERPKRMGAVIRLSPKGIRFWDLRSTEEGQAEWV